MRVRPFSLVPLSLVLAGGVAVASSSGGEDSGSMGQALIQPQIGTVFWTLVTFVIMLFILRKYAWGPLLGAVEAREKSIEENLDQARREREDAEKLVQEHRDLVAQARRERAEALAQGQRDAEKVGAEILDEARRQREQVLKQTEEQVQAAIQQARGEMRGITADLAIQAAEKLLAKNLDDVTQRELVEAYLTDLERTAGSSGLPS
jgi:F-type H+-transporting ATPase subunit b